MIPIKRLALVVIFLAVAISTILYGSLKKPENSPPPPKPSVTPCSAEDKSCSYLRDLYEKNPKLKQQLISELKKASLPQPNWIIDGMQTEIIRIPNDTETKILGFTCEPHNCTHSLLVLHNTKDGSVGGLYSTQGEELTFFGQINAEDRVRLCNESSSCVSNRENTLVHRLASELGFPIVKNRGFFGNSNCQPFNGKKRENVFGYSICEKQVNPNCLNSRNGTCSIFAIFTDEYLHSVSYTYEYENIDGEALKKIVDERFGDALVETKDLRPKGINMMSWHANWEFNNIHLSLNRFRGVNVNGQPYDNISFTVDDKSIPSPYPEYD